MAKFQFFAKFRIGAKLGVSLGLGVVLVAGMIAGEQINSNFVEGLVAAADKQQAIVNESTNTQVLMQKALIAGRDLRMAQSAKEVDSLLEAGRSAGEQINSNCVEGLVAAADKQQAIVNESTNTQVLMQKALIAGRDLR